MLNEEKNMVNLSFLEKILIEMIKNQIKYVDYNRFRQSLNLLDLDEIIYLMSSKNRSSMGYWFPKIVNEIRDETFFKIPKTTIIKVPMLLSQLICLGYDTINKITLDIVNEYCYKVCII